MLQLVLGRHHQKEKRFGPGPSNNYTSGTSKGPFWRRNKNTKRDTELGTVGTGGLVAEKDLHNYQTKNNTIRPSHDTAVTDSTMTAPDAGYGGPNNKYAGEPRAPVMTEYPNADLPVQTGYEPISSMTSPSYGNQGSNAAQYAATHQGPDAVNGGSESPYATEPNAPGHNGGYSQAQPSHPEAYELNSDERGSGPPVSETGSRSYVPYRGPPVLSHTPEPYAPVHNNGIPHVEPRNEAAYNPVSAGNAGYGHQHYDRSTNY